MEALEATRRGRASSCVPRQPILRCHVADAKEGTVLPGTCIAVCQGRHSGVRCRTTGRHADLRNTRGTLRGTLSAFADPSFALENQILSGMGGDDS